MGKFKIYHIKGKKVGCTTNIQRRVVEEQGYSREEYDILFETDDIEEAGKVERQLQADFNYPQDTLLYHETVSKNLKTVRISGMDGATTTFYKAIQDIDAIDIVGLMIRGRQIGMYEAGWIIQNLNKSQFNNRTCYIYNKAFDKFLTSHEPIRTGSTDGFFDRVRTWATDRNLYEFGDVKTQFAKLIEETGELGRSIVKEDEALFRDSVGDIVVVLVNLSHLHGDKIEDCMELAWDEIKDRKGRMIAGTFVKEQDLPENQ